MKNTTYPNHSLEYKITNFVRLSIRLSFILLCWLNSLLYTSHAWSQQVTPVEILSNFSEYFDQEMYSLSSALSTPSVLQLYRNRNWPYKLQDITFGKFLGKGFHGILFQIEDENQTHVIKVARQYRGQLENFRVEMKESLQNEMMVFNALPSHPNIIEVKAYYTDIYGEVIAIVIKREWGSLYEKIKELENKGKSLHHRQVLKYIKGMFLGLEMMHKLEIVHLDFYPDNLIIGEDQEIKVTDLSTSLFLKQCDPSIQKLCNPDSYQEDLRNAFKNALRINDFNQSHYIKYKIKDRLEKIRDTINIFNFENHEHLCNIHKWIQYELKKIEE